MINACFRLLQRSQLEELASNRVKDQAGIWTKKAEQTSQPEKQTVDWARRVFFLQLCVTVFSQGCSICELHLKPLCIDTVSGEHYQLLSKSENGIGGREGGRKVLLRIKHLSMFLFPGVICIWLYSSIFWGLWNHWLKAVEFSWE